MNSTKKKVLYQLKEKYHSSTHIHTYHSSCVSYCACVSHCACACACAGSGRAGCSKKDFYGTKIQAQKLLKVLEEDDEEIKDKKDK